MNYRAISSYLFFLLSIPIFLTGFWLRGHQLATYPPGISNDEAINAVDAHHIAQTGNFPMYEEDEGRAEPLFRIIEVFSLLAFGHTVWALRFCSVLLGMVTLASVIWVSRELLHDYPLPIRLCGALGAGIVIATMVGHVTLSRTLFRGILQLLIMSLSIGFMLRGMRLNRWRDYVLSGLFGGLTLYTYTAAWFFPPAFIILGLILLILRHQSWRDWLPKLVVLGIIALIVTAPIIYLLITYPRAVLGRADALTSEYVNWMRQIQVMINQFLVTGDENPQYNVALAPIIPELFQALFFIGLFGLIVRIRQPASWFITSLLLLLTLPALLSNETNHGLRIAGEYVIVPLIISLGIALCLWLLRQLIRNDVIVSALASIILLIMLGINAQDTWERYTRFYDMPELWRTWNVHEMQLNHNEWFFRTDRQDFAAWLLQQDTPLLIPIEELNRQTTRTWLINAYPTVTSVDSNFRLPDDTILVAPWSLERGAIIGDSRHYALLDNDSIILLPPLSDESLQEITRNVENGEVIEREGQINFLGYAQTIEPTDIAFNTQEVSDNVAVFGNGDIQLSGWFGEDTIHANQSYEFVFEWESLKQIGHEYLSSIQIQTQDYETVVGQDSYILRWIYPTTIWNENLPVHDVHTLQMAETLDVGAYRLTVGLYFASYPLIEAESVDYSIVDNRATVGWLKLPQETIPEVPITARSVNVTFADLFELTHIEFAASESGQLLAQLHWLGLENRPDIDATIFLHIVDESGAIVAQSDVRPQNGQYPTFIWDEGEVIKSDHVLNFNDLETLERYTVRVGMYTFPGPENLVATLGNETFTDGLVELGSLTNYFSE